jgi:hypothetical protein
MFSLGIEVFQLILCIHKIDPSQAMHALCLPAATGKNESDVVCRITVPESTARGASI